MHVYVFGFTVLKYLFLPRLFGSIVFLKHKGMYVCMCVWIYRFELLSSSKVVWLYYVWLKHKGMHVCVFGSTVSNTKFYLCLALLCSVTTVIVLSFRNPCCSNCCQKYHYYFDLKFLQLYFLLLCVLPSVILIFVSKILEDIFKLIVVSFSICFTFFA